MTAIASKLDVRKLTARIGAQSQGSISARTSMPRP
jgi:hypothetical protein